MRRPLAATAVLLVLLMLLLTGCNDEPEPRFSEPSETPSASLTEPTETASTDAPEAETAEEFIRRWQETSNAMQSSGDTTEFRTLNFPGCQPCNGFADTIQQYYQAGGFVETEGSKILGIESTGQSARSAQLDVTLRTTPTRFKKSADAAVETFGGGTSRTRFNLEKRNEDWLVTNYSILPS